MSVRARGTRNHGQCDSLLLSSICEARTFSYADIQNEAMIMGHETTTSKISERQLLCYQQRGAPVEEIVGLIVNGCTREVTNKLLMGFTAGTQRLLTISLEDSVG